MKDIFALVSMVLFCCNSYAVVTYAPTSTSSINGGGGYCLNATSGAITFTYNTCHAGAGSNVGVADTIRWYKNASNSTSGGTLVSTTVSSCATAATGTATYTPSTAAIGVLYYYCKITWAGSGVCNGTGSLTSSGTATVNVQPPAKTIVGSASVCTGLTTTYSDTTTGGTWSSTTTSVATITSAGVIRGVSAGTSVISYNTGCGNPATQTITVNTSTAAITGRSSICFNADTARLDTTTLANTTAGGAWSSSNTAKATINSSTGMVQGLDSGLAVISYTKTYSIGSCTSVANLNILTVPYPVISGPSHVCLGAEITMSGSGYYGTSGSWSSLDPSIAVIDNTGVDSGNSVGTTTIYYTTTNSCGASTANTSVTVYPLPFVDTIIGSTSVCAGAATLLIDSTSGGSWISDNTSIATVDASGNVTGVSAGGVVISYAKSTTYCGSDYNTVFMSVQAGGAGAIAGSANVCVGSNVTLTDTLTGGMWTTSNTSVASVGLLTGVVTGVGIGLDTITYTIVNACGTYTATKAIGVSQMTWIGGVHGSEVDWNTAGNWSAGFVPGASDDVLIPYGTLYPPVLSATDSVNVRSINVDTFAYVYIYTGGKIVTTGAVVNNGAVSGSGDFLLKGTSTQSVSGVGSFNKLSLDNTAGATIDTIGQVTINNLLTISKGILTTNSNLVLGSDSTGTASVGSIPADGAAISGNVTVSQYITGGRRAYRFWAHPFDAPINLNQLTPYIDISGYGGAANGFTTTASNAPSSYRYNPYNGNSSMAYDPGWSPFTSAYGAGDTNKLQSFEGIRVYYRGSKGQGLGFGPYTVISSTVIKMTGALNQGDKVVTMSKGSTGLHQDYNMVGNPYASPVDIGTILFNAAQADQITGASFYIWNPFLGVAGQFQSIPYSTGGSTPVAIPYYIQANDAFQVRAKNDSSILNFSENNKGQTISSAYSLMKAHTEYLTLNVYDVNYHMFDMLNIRFDDAATEQEDSKMDAAKRNGPDFNFYSISAEGQALAIDARPYQAEKAIKLGVNCSFAMDFIIRAENLAIPAGGKVYLHDNFLNSEVMLEQGTEYKFAVTEDKKSQGNSRFELRMDPAASTQTAAKALDVNMVPNPATDDVNIAFTNAKAEVVTLNVTDISGISVFNKNLGLQTSGTVNIPLKNMASGLYIVELTSGSQKITKKLVKE